MCRMFSGLLALACVVLTVGSVTAGTIVVVADVSDLDLANVATAVSFRSDAANDVIGGIDFYGVGMPTTNDPQGTTIQVGATYGFNLASAQPATSSPNLNFVFKSVGAVPQDLYSGQALTIDTPLANGVYQVQLMLYDGWGTASGVRLADIDIEGSVTTGYDYFLAQGGTWDNGAMLVETVSVTDGHLSITVSPNVSDPIVSGMIINSVVPEPGTLMLSALGLIGLITYAWRKRK